MRLRLLSDSPRQLLDSVDRPEDLRTLSPKDLREFCDELRKDLVRIVSKTGGHLGAGLGVVELTVALHRVFDTPRDKLIWDVSHQCYPHKMLTGRRALMPGLRKGGGLSGFTCRSESEFDPFGAAHSSTAISAALGFAAARDLSGSGENVIAVVGDGAMSGGMAFEGLNNLGAQGRKLIIVLNDNNMSIAPPSGALATHLAQLRSKLAPAHVRSAALRQGRLESYAGANTLFDAFGVRYVGPFDGHDIDQLVDALTLARDDDGGPILVHVLTEKGHGYAPAENAEDCMHGVSAFDIATGKQKKSAPGAPSYTSVFAKALIDEASRDERIVAVSAAMPTGTGLDKFGAVFPERCFDAGIAEQHTVTFCAGLACEGYKPFAAIYSTFLQRGYDQIVHDVAIQRLPVRFAIDRAGFVGADGVTHQGSYDITYLGCLPGFVLMAPADEAELVHMVATAAAIDDRPSAVRFPRGNGTGAVLPERGGVLEIGKGRIVREGDKAAILSYGSCLADAMEAAARLDEVELAVTVADARFAKPIDDVLVARLVRDHEIVVTLEAGSIGGFSALVFDSLVRQGLAHLMGRIVPMYLPDIFIQHDSPDAQAKLAGLNSASIVARIAGDRGRIAPRPHLVSVHQ
ncbi:MAG: 1-deoxy-D-xylulose-5-phosphate synthase [Alphaproteobacteria bacterium]|nr:1-deoxy-D-xylulose-5-phosphate synthase [Alphaproteobacteria bacterium]